MEDNKITAWAVIKHGNVDWVFNTEEKAKEQNKLSNGTVVKLTGEMPRKPIERKATAWVEFREPRENAVFTFDRLGIFGVWWHKTESCQTKVEITVKELSDE